MDKNRLEKEIHQLIEDRVSPSEIKDTIELEDATITQFVPSHIEEELL